MSRVTGGSKWPFPLYAEKDDGSPARDKATNELIGPLDWMPITEVLSLPDSPIPDFPDSDGADQSLPSMIEQLRDLTSTLREAVLEVREPVAEETEETESVMEPPVLTPDPIVEGISQTCIIPGSSYEVAIDLEAGPAPEDGMPLEPFPLGAEADPLLCSGAVFPDAVTEEESDPEEILEEEPEPEEIPEDELGESQDELEESQAELPASDPLAQEASKALERLQELCSFTCFRGHRFALEALEFHFLSHHASLRGLLDDTIGPCITVMARLSQEYIAERHRTLGEVLSRRQRELLRAEVDVADVHRQLRGSQEDVA